MVQKKKIAERERGGGGGKEWRDLNEINVGEGVKEVVNEGVVEGSSAAGDLQQGIQFQGRVGPEQCRHDGRHERQVRHLVLADGLDGVVDVEPPHHDHRAAEREEAHGEEGETVDVEHGQRRQVDIVTSRPRVLRRLEPHEQLHHCDQVAVRHHHALAPPARPRRVDDGGGVVLPHPYPHLHRRFGVGLEQRVEEEVELIIIMLLLEGVGHEDERGGERRKLSGVVGGGEHEGGGGVPQARGDLGGGAGGVHGGGDGAGGEDGEEGDGEGERVGEEEQDEGSPGDVEAAAEAGGEGGDEAAEVGAGEGGGGGGID